MDVYERIILAAKHKEPDRVPVAVDATGHLLKEYCGVTEYEYYQNIKLLY